MQEVGLRKKERKLRELAGKQKVDFEHCGLFPLQYRTMKTPSALTWAHAYPRDMAAVSRRVPRSEAKQELCKGELLLQLEMEKWTGMQCRCSQ